MQKGTGNIVLFTDIWVSVHCKEKHNFSHFQHTGSRENVDITMTRPQAESPMNFCSVSSKGLILISSPKRPNQNSRPQNVLFNGYPGAAPV
jgi:hypothetical protein